MENQREYVRELMVTINRIDGLWYRLARKSRRKVNTLSLLLALDDGKARTQSQICEEWIIPKTTINTIVKECLQLGYIELSKSKSAKEKLVSLTPKGQAYAQESLQLFYQTENAAMEKTLKHYSAEFISVLQEYSENLKEEIDLLYKKK